MTGVFLAACVAVGLFTAAPVMEVAADDPTSTDIYLYVPDLRKGSTTNLTARVTYDNKRQP